ncbi:Gpn-loop gtpase [Paramicrosporidium saccamoebae]|uniref:GPN-loop GTPase n=1 Tax=Paramicrosporidium saccamoebae TaxID=1246581 RepID=A0A2H9TM62_9FUNG|nr:Gpn-loop gtpase [Paramicrosporidium saccamoebae]
MKYYRVDDAGKIIRLRQECPAGTCGAGVFMAKHADRHRLPTPVWQENDGTFQQADSHAVYWHGRFRKDYDYAGKPPFLLLTVQRLNADLHADGTTPYVINLDPAVLELPYTANIDIRDTVNYKEVMQQYKLGPNGGILTSLNLFTTRFDQVLELVEKRTEKHILVDTPGQIELFTWSASGAIITETLAAQHPTVVVYIVDTPRCVRPATFMSNMLYACSIMYKTRLPMVLVFNKTDMEPADTMIEWMQDVLTFQEALQEESYMNSLVQSMSLVLEEFYKTLRVAAVSAFTGEGMDEFFEKLDEAVAEYDDEYRPDFERRVAERKASEEKHKEEQLAKLVKDLSIDAGEQDTDTQASTDTEEQRQ